MGKYKGQSSGRETFMCLRNTKTGKVQKMDVDPAMGLIKEGEWEEISLDLYHEIKNNEPETFRLGDNLMSIYAKVDKSVFTAFKKRADKEVSWKGKYHSALEAALVYLVEGFAAGLDLARPKQGKTQTGIDYIKEHK